MFSGQLPSYHGTHRNSKSFKKSRNESLAGALSAEGYRTGGFSANPWLCSDLRFDTGFDHFESLSGVPPFSDEDTAPDTPIENLYSTEGIQNVLSWAFNGNPVKRFANGFWKRYLDTGPGVKRINKSILEWINEREEEKMFVFANYMDVHDPHYISRFRRSDIDLPSQSTRFDPTKSPFRAVFSKRVDFMSEPDEPERARRLYDRAIRRVDEGLRDFFNELENTIDLEDSLIVILGDHGECLGEGDYWGHGTYLHEKLIRIPLFISPPGGSQPFNGDRPISILDVVEYINEVTNSSMESEAADAPHAPSNRAIFAETVAPRPNMKERSLLKGFETVIQDGEKLTRNRTTGESKLTNVDNGKRRSENSREHLKTLLDDQWMGVDTESETDQDDMISEERRSRLEDLGYL